MNATATVPVEKILDYDCRINDYAEVMKVIHDGQHFVATPIQKAPAISRVRRIKDGSDLHFEKAYFAAMKKKSKWKEEDLASWISAYMVDELGDIYGYDLNWIRGEIDRFRHNLFLRQRRFRNKAYLNSWNYFVTITYDESKMDADTFRASLRKCFSNLHSRHGWKYMGVFELGEEGERLHFHALVYVPDGEMIGSLKSVKRYSTKRHQWDEHLENSFFNGRFGISTFDPISRKDVKSGAVVNYVIKYLLKSGERVIYSRAIPTELVVMVQDDQIAAKIFDFVGKFVLFDDAFTLWSDPDDEPEVIQTE